MDEKLNAARAEADKLLQKIAAVDDVIMEVVREAADKAYAAIVLEDAEAQAHIARCDDREDELKREQKHLHAALDTANQKVIDAERETVAAADADRAAERKARFAALNERAGELDRMANELTSAFTDFQKEAAAIGRLTPGVSSSPSYELVSVGTRRALAAHLRATGLPLQAIPPSQRLTFAVLAQNWSGTTSADEHSATAA